MPSELVDSDHEVSGNPMALTAPRARRSPARVRAAPHAGILIESMRDVGYTLGSALADVIDNSITAGARKVRIFAETADAAARIAVLDDGRGMTADELMDAMRLGSRSPLESRDGNDLGRFGLGMKTASFSQCRRLTVMTRREGRTSVARWDLDTVLKTDDWLVEIPADDEAIPWSEDLQSDGTMVLWERLDRLVDPHGVGQADLVRRLDEAAGHLELVFHRFLTGERGLRRVAISLNSRSLVPVDPFHSDHPATIAGPPETIRVGRQNVTIQTFTLPHHKKVSPEEWERFAGPGGYVRNQGFYVYRARRLIIHGTWFGLARQMELTKLARVRIDMPNALDSEWKVDIKKASAQPPPQVRQRLRQLIETIGANSKNVYTRRGRRLADSRLPVWQRVQNKNQISYRVNSEHPVIADFSARLPEALKPALTDVLEVVSSAIPMDAIFADISGQPESVGGAELSQEALERAVRTTYQHLRREGMATEMIAEMLQATEPFRSSWPAAAAIISKLESANGVSGD